MRAKTIFPTYAALIPQIDQGPRLKRISFASRETTMMSWMVHVSTNGNEVHPYEEKEGKEKTNRSRSTVTIGGLTRTQSG